MLFLSPPFGNYVVLPYATRIRGSFTLHPKSGLFSRIRQTLRYDWDLHGWVNKIGLCNIGIGNVSFIPNDIYSIYIGNESEVDSMRHIIPQSISIEINISCPNVNRPQYNIPYNIGTLLGRPWCIVKLSPLHTFNDIDILYKLGIRQFHYCNTLPVGERGGLSGPSLKPYVLEKIRYTTATYPNTTIIAGGGIQTIQDVIEYKDVGADHFSVSTLCLHPYRFLSFYCDYIRLNYHD